MDDAEGRSRLTTLAWDSGFFGFPVAKVASPDLADDDLELCLRSARREGFRLVYWATGPARGAPESLLREFAGLRADRKANYQAILAHHPTSGATDAAPAVAELPRGPASPALVALSVASGAFSRFRADPRIPPGKCDQLFERWIDGSTRGVLADTVLVAAGPGDHDTPGGMAAVSRSDDGGQIRLIAVREDCRGRGVGRALVLAAHGWMRERGLQLATVVTQLENAPACRLYESCGYRLASVENYYHFWPSDGGPGPT